MHDNITKHVSSNGVHLHITNVKPFRCHHVLKIIFYIILPFEAVFLHNLKKMQFNFVSMYLARKYQLGTLYIFMSPTGDGTAILRGHPSHAKV